MAGKKNLAGVGKESFVLEIADDNDNVMFWSQTCYQLRVWKYAWRSPCLDKRNVGYKP